MQTVALMTRDKIESGQADKGTTTFGERRSSFAGTRGQWRPPPTLAERASQPAVQNCKHVYVVYMGSKTGEDPDDILKQNHQMLTAVHRGSVEEAHASHVYSYRHGFKGFAAKLTVEQASQISDMPGVVSVFPNSKRILHTTHSWDFIGLPDDKSMEIFGHSTRNQANVIIGFIDTGIWPESPSFKDSNMPPVPSEWKGHCQTGEAFNASSCNSGFEAEEGLEKKVSFKSPRDSSGHGSHTASIAAGCHVANMSYKGLGAGKARGGAPMARIAVYKTCWDSGCYDADLLAAFDDAIRDGVHILSLSLGPEAPQGDYFSDAISVGSFHAASHGVLVVSSAGNNGNPGSATNLAPWMITVAASSTDRDFISDIRLGNGANIKGESLSLLEMKANTRILPASEAFAGYFTPYQSSYCLDSSLNESKAKGNVLVCQHAESSTESKLAKSEVVKQAGGVGMILIDELDLNVAIPFVIPSAIVGRKTGEMILSYVNSTRKPTSRIFRSKTVFGTQPAPLVAAFSSKGPNSLTPEILKPDVTAPGLNILAAWSPAKGNMMYNILSGTSMSCPHITGIAALVKTVHPSWSSSAIKSAIMTTATTLDKQHGPIRADPGRRKANAFDYGSGFVNPASVLNPGLIYDIKSEDYIEFLCSLNYDDKSLRLITRDNSTCHGHRKFKTASDLNYPSIIVPNLKDNFTVSRTVTNVGEARSIYKSEVSSPAGVNVTVVPNQLNFARVGQKIKFMVNFKVVAPSKGYEFGFLSWKNRRSQVTSPLVVRGAPANLGMVW
ncbi:subtilisin-like serine-protease S isoform X4 [Prosopis cineraria]|uniref:subtilisin-like serine-protease S isoform X4 n=1 Tax=Prosopis cineraria TaxID=364024 RepID=UPI00240F6134|nr:subtilisin-like serine-protease S isoform X4 [Prosopis cineraria]